MTRLRRWWRAATAGFVANPEAVPLVVLCFLGGLAALFGDRPGTIARALPHWLQALWAGALLAGGGLRTIGLLARRVDIDGAGCWLLGPPAIIYGAIVLLLGGRGGVVSGSIILAVGAGALVRCRQYFRQAREDREPRRARR